MCALVCSCVLCFPSEYLIWLEDTCDGTMSSPSCRERYKNMTLLVLIAAVYWTSTVCQSSKQAVWKRVNISLLSLENAACKVNLWLAYGNLNLGRVLTSPRNNSAEAVVCIVYLLSFWEFGFLVCAEQRVPMWLAPNTNPESLMSFPSRQHFTHIVTACCWGNSARSVWICWERTLGCLFLQTSSGHLFPLLVLLFTPSLLLILAMSTIRSVLRIFLQNHWTWCGLGDPWATA